MTLWKRMLIAGVAAASLSGCLIGPERGADPVHPDWKARREVPFLLDPDWEYQGEPFEQYYLPDDADS